MFVIVDLDTDHVIDYYVYSSYVEAYKKALTYKAKVKVGLFNRCTGEYIAI